MARTSNRLKAIELRSLDTVGRYSDGLGLYLAVTGSKSGAIARSWLFQFTSPKTGNVRQMGLGPLHTVGLALAREKAAEARRLVQDGKDPIEVRLLERQAARAASDRRVTFRSLAEQVIEKRQGEWKSAVHAKQWSYTLEKYAYPTIGHLDVVEITKQHVLDILEPIWHKKTETASRLQGRISSVLELAKARQLVSFNPAAWSVLKQELASPKALKKRKGKHHAAIEIDELPGFMAKLRARKSVTARALEFCILCASRTSEVIGATDDEVNYQTRTWTIPGHRMKADQKHLVPLTDCAIEILRGLPRERGSKFLFVGPGRGKRLSNMAMLSLAKKLHPGTTVHGFRAVFSSWAMERMYFPVAVVKLALAHTLSEDVFNSYQRSELWDRRKHLADEWAKFCASPPVEKSNNVVPLRKAKVR